MTLTCQWCGTTFERPNTKGPAPRYCKASHRQRAYEHRNALPNPWHFVPVESGTNS